MTKYELYEIKEVFIKSFEKPDDIHKEISKLKKSDPNKKYKIKKRYEK